MFASGSLLAEHRPNSICSGCVQNTRINEINPVTGSGYKVDGYGGDYEEERDPLGAIMGTDDPMLYFDEPTYLDMLTEGQPLYLEANPWDPNDGCELDGVAWDCSDIVRQAEYGTVVGGIVVGGQLLKGQVSLQHALNFTGGGWLSIFIPGQDVEFGYDDPDPFRSHTFTLPDQWETLYIQRGGPNANLGPVSLDQEFTSNGVTYIVGQDCIDALAVAQKNIRNLRQAFDNLDRINAISRGKGIGAGWLMALGVRESGAGDDLKEDGGFGRGWYQIDRRVHPRVTEAQAMDFEWATGFVSELLKGNLQMVENYQRADRRRSGNVNLSYTFDQRVAMMFRIYNAGPVSESMRQRLILTDDATVLDAGTANGNYASNLVNLHTYCIAGAQVKGRGF
ncbi:MAG: hypothetical protein IT173_15960 [Acidobacteria bacterium]|nr:hypothetical protein [Acidobacteriota bacterium]